MVAAVLAAVLMGMAPMAAADPSPAPAAPSVPAQPADPGQDVTARRGDLALIQGEIKLSDETLARLRDEIQSLGADRDKLRQQLVDTGNRTHDTESKVAGRGGAPCLPRQRRGQYPGFSPEPARAAGRGARLAASAWAATRRPPCW